MRVEKRRQRKGFTLVELMAVMLIIALLAGIAVKNFMGTTDKAKVTTTKATLGVLHEAVQMFKLDTGRYPSEEVGLEELIVMPSDVEGWAQGGYLESTELPQDGWKNEFIYLLDPGTGKPFVIISYGADGKEGGEGYDYDLYSTDAD